MKESFHKQNSIRTTSITWIIRILILCVLGWNIQCAFVFLTQPTAYTSGFQLPANLVGMTVIRSLGLLFLMWNIPYGFAAIHPLKWKICLPIAFIQQLIGVVGEFWILSTLQPDTIIRTSIEKFFVFDSVGLGLLAAAFILQYYLIVQERKS